MREIFKRIPLKMLRQPASVFLLLASMILPLGSIAYATLPPDFDRSDELYQLGLLDVTKAPYSADPTGQADSTVAIQRAVNDARDNWLVCFFPEGTYRISDTISCEQQVEKLERPRATDGRTQHYWDRPHRIVLFGSGKGKRPVIKLAEDAKGFGDPRRPKFAIKVWAQTRNDAPGKEEPVRGEEQPNIAFNHYFKGKDCRHLRIFYFKVEAGTLNRGGDANTPSAIESCQDVRIHCMVGNVRKLQDRPMLSIVESEDVVVSQLKAFQPSSFPHLIETHGPERNVIPSTTTCALFVRHKGGTHEAD